MPPFFVMRAAFLTVAHVVIVAVRAAFLAVAHVVHRRAPAFLGKQPRTSSCAPHSSRLRPSSCTRFPCWKAAAHVVLRTAFVAVAQVHVKKVGPPVAVASAMQRGFTSVRPRTVRLSHDLPSCTLAPSDELETGSYLLKLAPAFTAGRLQLRAHRGLQRELFAKQACVVSLLAAASPGRACHAC